MGDEHPLTMPTANRPGLTRVTVDPLRALGELDRALFGGFVEHLGRCINGGLFEPGSALSDGRGFRRDVLDLLRPLRLSVLRWPGGNFASNYHWVDGVGPRASRPSRVELAWGGVEPNQFGTDEFLAYCAELGATPYICLNMGTGDLAEALAWVEYCNSSANSLWAQRRRENGRREPYRVPYWGLGNEMYGSWQVGAMSAEEYVAEATRWARAIKMLDPDARLVSCGEVGWTDWDRKVVDGLASLVDLHSVHIYTGSDDYWTNVLSPHVAERAIATASTFLRRAAYVQDLKRVPRLAYDEWNVWYRTMSGGLEERYVFSDALAVGTFLNIFIRNCRWVAMANLAQMVNAIAPVVTTAQGCLAQPIYFPFLLSSQGHLDVAVDTFVEGATIGPPQDQPSRWPYRVDDLGPFTLVDTTATVDRERRRLALTLVNRSQEAERAEVRLRLGGFVGPVRLRTATSGGRAGPGEVESTEVADGDAKPKDNTFVIELPAQSFTLAEANISVA